MTANSFGYWLAISSLPSQSIHPCASRWLSGALASLPGAGGSFGLHGIVDQPSLRAPETGSTWPANGQTAPTGIPTDMTPPSLPGPMAPGTNPVPLRDEAGLTPDRSAGFDVPGVVVAECRRHR